MEDNQLELFELESERALLEEQRSRFLSANRSPNTIKAYGHSWKRFSTWCVRFGFRNLPASSQTAELFLLQMLHDGLNVHTAEVRLAGIGAVHRDAGFESPVTRDARKLLVGARRMPSAPSRRKIALTVENLREISLSLNAESAMDARDRAILVIGFSSGLRRSNLVMLQLDDVQFVPSGLSLRVRREKTDQEGVGRFIGVSRGCHRATCPVRTLSSWLRARGRQPGPLFCQVSRADRVFLRPISGEAVCAAVKQGVSKLGLDPNKYGAHSLRSGFVTAAAEAGVSPFVIMQRTGHKSMDTLQMYFRPTRLFAVDPLAGLL